MTHQCPRREELGDTSVFKIPETDNFDQGVCSWCGSMSQEDFFKAVEAGEVITPTDKSYKVYVAHARKFYFQHLDDGGRTKFIELHNAHKMNLAYPGHFYVTPFFCEKRHD